ncbi:hypothetical protein BOTBODRAFT_108855 [Botryobasidium botryosum FD-172 SS1]|uniref:Mei2-like C-terminal RNA recognition motif domain-containing protein n=1 Tax=Botryobasidium botryosum (strain FD-172 SS1) TaxID=930990 RepID=A0A067MIB9_BOTB1|nr:hypothetical protein BOTBODRAFT_108855 [Botryobasidium botryosum FD-172 SS1]
MLKNVPNKMSDKDLIAFINKVCPRRIDFLYLRIDFANRCNVGYAFVNFITVEDLLLFCNARLGRKWNMFQSEKVLGMSYANFQGKEALVEKFRNSSVMNEKLEWRPKIFYSDGPNYGLPEPFPAPNNLLRQERSRMNKNAVSSPSALLVSLYYPLLGTGLLSDSSGFTLVRRVSSIGIVNEARNVCSFARLLAHSSSSPFRLSFSIIAIIRIVISRSPLVQSAQLCINNTLHAPHFIYSFSLTLNASPRLHVFQPLPTWTIIFRLFFCSSTNWTIHSNSAL